MCLHLMPRRMLLLVFLLIMAAGSLSKSEAQVPPGPVLDQAYLPIQIEPQQTLAWCWVASARMIANYYNKQTPPQCMMLQEQYGAPCCANPGQVCTQDGTIYQVQQLIQTFGLQASMIGRPANGLEILNWFKQGHPIVLHVIINGLGHFVVASGMQVVQTPGGQLGIVRILDPFFGPQEVPLPQLYQMWDAAVYVE
jgi:hypothetical protein